MLFYFLNTLYYLSLRKRISSARDPLECSIHWRSLLNNLKDTIKMLQQQNDPRNHKSNNKSSNNEKREYDEIIHILYYVNICVRVWTWMVFLFEYEYSFKHNAIRHSIHNKNHTRCPSFSSLLLSPPLVRVNHHARRWFIRAECIKLLIFFIFKLIQ